jgi:hypothetical protein
MRLRNSIWGFLGRDETEAPEVVVQRVRMGMLLALAEHVSEDMLVLEYKLGEGRSIESLWYLRPEIMNAVASSRGESVARDCMVQITAMFNGHQPGATPSHFGPL